jgi:polyisoprenyl-phosphate glycosyltransferase
VKGLLYAIEDIRLDKKITVVIPVYKSEDCLDELVKRLTSVLNNFAKTYEIVLVNDCSPDNSWNKIIDLCKVYDNLKGINLRKNFGQDCAIMAGLNNSSGEFVIIMDDDLQHDPKDIPILIGKLEEGYDVCYALFESKKQSWFKNFGSWFNGKVAEIVIDKPKNVYLSPYKAIKRGVIDEIIKYDGPYPYVDGLIFRVTRNITQVKVEHHERYSGQGNYNLIKSIRVWLRLATNFSVFPLRIATVFGFVASIIGFLMALYFIIQRIVDGQSPIGWASMIVTVLFVGGIQLMAIGTIGEYIGRLFIYYSKEPQFVVKEIVEKSDNSISEKNI